MDSKILKIEPKEATENIPSKDRESYQTIDSDEKVDAYSVVENIYALRSNFLIIGLTGRTGSGCSTVAEILSEKEFSKYKSNYKSFNSGQITNQVRKDRIVHNFLEKNWVPFTVIKVRDLIYYFAFQLSFDDFVDAVIKGYQKDKDLGNGEGDNEENTDYSDRIKECLTQFNYDDIHKKITELKEFFDKRGYRDTEEPDELIKYTDMIFMDLSDSKKDIEEKLNKISKSILPRILQTWGDNIRTYKSVVVGERVKDAPEALARVVNQTIKLIRTINDLKRKKSSGDEQFQTCIVIDSLRNPFEILFFRERWSSFYCMSINTTREIRYSKLMTFKKLSLDDIYNIDEREKEKKNVGNSFSQIDIDRCIQLSDIFVNHDGTPHTRNFNLINQLHTYIALMLHPGLIPPSSQERLMQVAYTAKLNSGCLSRQVGAAITDEEYSLKGIGWNSSPSGTVPCSLRNMDDLYNQEDLNAFSEHEIKNKEFQERISLISNKASEGWKNFKNLNGIGLSYCFKDIHGGINPKQKYNQVHTRSLHAEENAFLQIAKYGGMGIKGGKLFTTASCCELCAKKAYHLGIKEIYYIDSYPGISMPHVLSVGSLSQRPKMILFSGAVGRAYVNLFNPFMPLKDEFEARTGINMKDVEDSKHKDSKTYLTK